MMSPFGGTRWAEQGVDAVDYLGPIAGSLFR